MLKKNITAAEYAKLNEALKAEYKEDGDGYIVDVEGGFEDVAALKRAKDHEKKEASRLKQELNDTQTQLAALTEERDGILKGAIPKADHEKLENSYKAKLEKREAELNKQLDALRGTLTGSLLDGEALKLATAISVSPKVMLPHIKARMKAEIGADGKPVTKILDAEGNPSSLTIEDLQKEFVDNKDYSALLIGSKGSGGGANGNQGGGGASIRSRKDFKNGTEEAIYANANPEAYAKLPESL